MKPQQTFSKSLLLCSALASIALSGCRLSHVPTQSATAPAHADNNSVSVHVDTNINNMNVNINGSSVVINGRAVNVPGNGAVIVGNNWNSGAGRQQATADFRQTLQADGVQALSVRGENGNVSVTAASDGANRIVVHAMRQLHGKRSVAQLQALIPQLKVTATIEGARLVLKSEYPRAWDNGDIGVVVNYDVTVPARLSVEASDVNGSVSLQGMKNSLDVATENGNVQLIGVAGAIHAGTTNGSIALANVSYCTEVRLRVENGNVVASDVEGSGSNVDIVTKNGGVEYSGSAGDLTLKTTNGTIFAVLNASPQNAHLVSVSGSLDLHLPANASAHLTADTTNGTVDVPHATRNEERTSAQATFGSGRASIALNATNGNISVEVP